MPDRLEAARTKVARLLFNARMARGLTQKQLSLLSGIDPAVYSRYERGERTPCSARFVDLWERLGGTLALPPTGGLGEIPDVHDVANVQSSSPGGGDGPEHGDEGSGEGPSTGSGEVYTLGG